MQTQSINDIKYIISSLKKYYKDADSVEQDIRSIITKYPKFRLSTVISRISNKQQLALTGYLPITFNSRSFGIPLLISFTYEYPISAPEILCNISEGMEIVKNHPEVDENGVVRKIGNEWNPSSDLLMVLDSLAKSFGSIPPVRQASATKPSAPQGYSMTTSTTAVQPTDYAYNKAPYSMTTSQYFTPNYPSNYGPTRTVPIQPQQQYQTTASYRQPFPNKIPYPQQNPSFIPLTTPTSYSYQPQVNPSNYMTQSTQFQQYSPNTNPPKPNIPADVQNRYLSTNPTFSPSSEVSTELSTGSTHAQPLNPINSAYPTDVFSSNKTETLSSYSYNSPQQPKQELNETNDSLKTIIESDPYLIGYNPDEEPSIIKLIEMLNNGMIQQEAYKKLRIDYLNSEEHQNKLQKYREEKKKQEEERIRLERIRKEEEERKERERIEYERLLAIQREKERLRKKINDTNDSINKIGQWISENNQDADDPLKVILKTVEQKQQESMKSLSVILAVEDCTEILEEATKNNIITIEEALVQLKKIGSIQFEAKFNSSQH